MKLGSETGAATEVDHSLQQQCQVKSGLGEWQRQRWMHAGEETVDACYSESRSRFLLHALGPSLPFFLCFFPSFFLLFFCNLAFSGEEIFKINLAHVIQ